MLRVLGQPGSINVRKVLWLCDELGLAVWREDWGRGFRPTDSTEFLALNPNGLVPVLIDGDAVLWESNTICRYLAGRAGREDLLPSAPLARAKVEQWMDWQATELNPAWRYVFMARVRHGPGFADAQAAQASEAAWNRLMGLLDQQLARHAHVAGATFTLADIVLGLSTYRWLMTPITRPELPHVQAWFASLASRPGFVRHCRNGTP